MRNDERNHRGLTHDEQKQVDFAYFKLESVFAYINWIARDGYDYRQSEIISQAALMVADIQRNNFLELSSPEANCVAHQYAEKWREIGSR